MRKSENPGPISIGPFRVVRRIGSGGMAETFEGTREGPGGFVQRVCLKRILPALAGDDELRRLFLREARLAALLRHRNVTQVVELGRDEGVHYLALELVDGMDLRTLLRGLSDRRLPIQLAILVGLEVAEAIEHAHTHGVVHRDISPQNILVSVEGEVKLTDFGISKALDDLRTTRSDVVRGNIWYMAPELLERGAVATAQSDLFSLGLVLFECLSGTRPYPASSPSAATLAVAAGAVASLRDVAPDLPEAVLMLVERLTAFRPEDRFPDARAVVDTLAPLTREATARRALGERVRERRERPSVLAADHDTEPSAPRADLEEGVPSDPAVRDPTEAPKIRERWQKYAFGPKVWASATRAALLRSTRSRNPPPPSSVPPETQNNAALPPPWKSPVWVATLALLLLALVSVAAVGLTLTLN